MRHAPFAIDSAARDAWLRAMRTAVADADLPPTHADQLLKYFESTAEHMVNRPG
jgi:hemoglobin